jgi:hypothetical protein
MPTECTPKLFEFEAVERRAVVAQFDGGTITSNAGSPIGLATAKQSSTGRNMRYACGSRSPEFERF